MLTVYVAGPITSTDHLTFLGNCRRGMEICAEVMKLGYAPLHIFTDFLYALVDGEVTVQHLIDSGMAWLEKADVILMTGDWQNSKGSMAEYKRARELGKKVFTDLDAMHRELSR